MHTRVSLNPNSVIDDCIRCNHSPSPHMHTYGFDGWWTHGADTAIASVVTGGAHWHATFSNQPKTISWMEFEGSTVLRPRAMSWGMCLETKREGDNDPLNNTNDHKCLDRQTITLDEIQGAKKMSLQFRRLPRRGKAMLETNYKTNVCMFAHAGPHVHKCFIS